MELLSWLDMTGGRFVTGLLIFARFGALLFSMPMFSTRNVPVPIRVGLAALLALLLAPLSPPYAGADMAPMAAGLLKEILVGLVLGWTASLLFAAVQMAGEWLDVQAGFQMAQMMNPAFETHSAPLGTFKYLVAGLVFLGAGGHAMMIRAAAHSLAVSPPGALTVGMGAADGWTALLTQTMWISIQLAAPAGASLFVAETAIALADRALPQVHVMMLALPLKALMGVGALALALPMLVQMLAGHFSNLEAGLGQVLRGMGQ